MQSVKKIFEVRLYIYIYRERERERERDFPRFALDVLGKALGRRFATLRIRGAKRGL